MAKMKLSHQVATTFDLHQLANYLVELAFWNGSNDVVNHFLYSGIVDQKPSDGNDLLFLALSNKHISIASKLLDTGKYDSNSRVRTSECLHTSLFCL